ncbi:MAG: hypothetical protein LH478_05905 [Chitinophagaceae bacterium]|nr:hypothetical protein [Chitinophagaceae bacterium]
MKKLLLLCLCTVTILTTKAQDKIFRKNGQTVKAKIIEIGTSDIKYKMFGEPESPVYVLEKDRIVKVQYEDGRIEKFTTDIKDPEQYIGQLGKAIKVDFFGPLLGYTQVTFEKSTGVGKSYELSLGIIGAGKNQRIEYYNNNLQVTRRNQFGLFGAAGYKFNKLPDFLFGRSRFTHIMQGAYAKPVLYVGNYSENRLIDKGTNQLVTDRRNVTFGALQVELGKQWVFGDKFLLDFYWGLGYGFDNKKGDYYNNGFYEDNGSAYNYANARLGTSPGISTTFGLKVGWLIK